MQHCVNALTRAVPISTTQFIMRPQFLHIVSMPLLGLSPFLLNMGVVTINLPDVVSMPLLGLSPFLRSTLGSRINRGHNLETIHVIVRQFIFAPILTSFFPSLGIFALFRRNGLSYNIFIIHVSRHRLKAFFSF